ncbi:MAG: ATP-dependent DNA helicase [Actinomycetes bacterium]
MVDDSRSEYEHWRADPAAVLDAAVHGLGGEDRPGQRMLADAVADAIRRGHHLVAEAPTGSGKSLAYLSPAVASGLRVVVATATIALQDQLIGKDVPQLRRASGVPCSAVTLKGRANYVCLAKLGTATDPDALFDVRPTASFDDDVDAIRAFAASSTTGDRAELPADVSDSSWAACSCSGQECPGARECEEGPRCFAERARGLAAEADIVIVNHALACLDLGAEGNVLPDHDVLVVDEAHAFPEAATRSFGVDLAPVALGRLATMLRRHGAPATSVDALDRSADHLRGLLDGLDGHRLLGEPLRSVQGACTAVAEHLAAARAGLTTSDDAETKRTGRLAATRIETVRRIAEGRPDEVLWVEGRGERARIRLAPLEVGSPLAEHLLSSRPTVLVSATLGGTPPFGALATALGLDPDAEPGHWGEPPGPERDPDEPPHRETGRGYVALTVPPTFDWREQGTLFVDPTLPDPTRDRVAWLEASGEHVVALVRAAGGRALILCTSRANVGHYAGLLRAADLGDGFEGAILVQGEAAAAELTRRFLADERSVLVGTRTFWAGIDAPGAACVLVVIDRIPFPVPNEPLHAARRERAEAEGLDAFGTVDIPAAALTLAQGAGRLLRRRADRGVVAVLDPRLATRNYRRRLLDAMPPFRRTVDLDEACAALHDAAGGDA